MNRLITRARALAPHGLKVEVEVDTLAQLDEALAIGVDIVLLDNFSDADTRTALARLGAHSGPRPLVEVSGGITLDTIASYSATGVDMISVGAITNSAPVLDLGLDLD